ncbi:hypothetical protein ABG067_006567 [Albugo candida]
MRSICAFGALIVLIFAFALNPSMSVDQNKFRTCSQTRFCRKYRQKQGEKYIVDPSSVHVIDTPQESVVRFDLASSSSPEEVLEATLSFVIDEETSTNPAIRFQAAEKWNDDKDPRRRWVNSDVLQPPAFHTRPLISVSPAESTIPVDTDNPVFIYTLASPRTQIQPVNLLIFVYTNPFKIDVFMDNEKVISFNDHNQFHFEYRKHRDPIPSTSRKEIGTQDINTGKDLVSEDIHNGKEIVDYGEDGLAIYSDGTTQAKASTDENTSTDTDTTDDGWEEHFKDHIDKPVFGPSSIGVDISFYSSKQLRQLYGLPEHATDFVLKDTIHNDEIVSDPYRLYNLDVFEYELDVPMALYGSIPLLMAANTFNSVGVLWHNPSETFVDVITDANTRKKTSHWMSESGVLDVFFLIGPLPQSFSRQYVSLTGTASMPPLFALGYHQCRWNYRNERDVDQVNAGFDQHKIPYDVLWLDIEHTDGKRYFTWDPIHFPSPISMQENLAIVGRKVVTIVDPHIKIDPAYYVHSKAESLGYYVKDEHGNDFHGWCWPGDSSYLDFTSHQVRYWWASLFRYETYAGSTSSLYTWNDMNEPSVFNGPEVSMHKGCLNLEGVEHREWHNLYGFHMQKATAEGQLVRQLASLIEYSGHDFEIQEDMERPFVLSRSFFAGSQRFGAIWNGDNAAKWEHLKYTTKMLLSMSIAGLTFVGADIGGFFGNPDTELLTRWYQAAAYQPFFRGHAHHDSDRREPWVFGEPHTSHIRSAIRERYSLLPQLYTLFYICSTQGLPIIRPLWYHFDSDEILHQEDAFLLGSDLLIHPVVEPGITSISVFLPSDSIWYSVFQQYKPIVGQGKLHDGIPAPIEHIPVFQRGGSIITRKRRVRRSSALMHHDPVSLLITLDSNVSAKGQLYLDDERTFAYKVSNRFTLVHLECTMNGLQSFVAANGYASSVWVERIEIYGFGALYKVPTNVLREFEAVSAVISAKTNIKEDDMESGVSYQQLDFTYDLDLDQLIVRKPALKLHEVWKLQFRYGDR